MDTINWDWTRPEPRECDPEPVRTSYQVADEERVTITLSDLIIEKPNAHGREYIAVLDPLFVIGYIAEEKADRWIAYYDWRGSDTVYWFATRDEALEFMRERHERTENTKTKIVSWL